MRGRSGRSWSIRRILMKNVMMPAMAKVRPREGGKTDRRPAASGRKPPVHQHRRIQRQAASASLPPVPPTPMLRRRWASGPAILKLGMVNPLPVEPDSGVCPQRRPGLCHRGAGRHHRNPLPQTRHPGHRPAAVPGLRRVFPENGPGGPAGRGAARAALHRRPRTAPAPRAVRGLSSPGAVLRPEEILSLYVSGDIGCYTLGAQAPLAMIDTCVCMGASISGLHGFNTARGTGAGEKVRGRYRRFHLYPFRHHRV